MPNGLLPKRKRIRDFNLMTTQTPAQSANPFSSRGEYSSAAVELMRAMSDHRKQIGAKVSSPAQVLSVVKSLGYQFAGNMSDDDQRRLFELAIRRYEQHENSAHLSCEDVVKVIETIGFRRVGAVDSAANGGLPIDRRRREADERKAQAERRASLEFSPQELLDLTSEEHQFLDCLKELREATDRDFASSEELLSIVWSLGYRPTSDDGFPNEWLDDEQRYELQLAFTLAVEDRLANASDEEYLTCRSVLEIVQTIGFRLP